MALGEHCLIFPGALNLLGQEVRFLVGKLFWLEKIFERPLKDLGNGSFWEVLNRAP